MLYQQDRDLDSPPQVRTMIFLGKESPSLAMELVSLPGLLIVRRHSTLLEARNRTWLLVNGAWQSPEMFLVETLLLH